MALIKCHECNNEISSKAKACPKCGAKPKRTGFFGWLFIIFVLIVFVSEMMNPPGKPATPESKPVAKQEKSPEEKMRDTKVVFYGNSIKANSRDPKSLEWITILANQDGSTICFKYRGRNGLGGISVQNTVIVKDSLQKASNAWNQHCTKEGVEDVGNSMKWVIDNIDKF
ncbi:MAG: hypothetical protein GC136_09505 [Alphaproteobacteria bacterium]|nr:hypothetical protein [Alphaproteobacteria bacterium]